MFREYLLDIQDYESEEIIQYRERLRTRRPYFDSWQGAESFLSVPVIYVFQNVHLPTH
jgi:hypothetical protein